MPPRQRASKSPARAARPAASPAARGKGAAAPADVSWAAQQTPLGVFLNNYLAPLLTMLVTPYLAYVVTYITSLPTPTISAFLDRCAARGVYGIHADIFAELEPTAAAAVLLLVFNFVALLIYWWPGPTEHGPVTIHGHTPEYADNGVAHCILFTLSFLGGSELGLGWYKLSVLYDHFGATIGALNVFGLVFCAFLYIKGRHFPSGPDAGSSGCGLMFDYYWGMELYPRICNVDVKKFVNCRFSMTFWQFAGISFCAASRELHGRVDPGLLLCALSQFLYLAKFYVWEIGYTRMADRVRVRVPLPLQVLRVGDRVHALHRLHPLTRTRTLTLTLTLTITLTRYMRSIDIIP